MGIRIRVKIRVRIRPSLLPTTRITRLYLSSSFSNRLPKLGGGIRKGKSMGLQALPCDVVQQMAMTASRTAITNSKESGRGRSTSQNACMAPFWISTVAYLTFICSPKTIMALQQLIWQPTSCPNCFTDSYSNWQIPSNVMKQ